jgi:hypothetical protein
VRQGYPKTEEIISIMRELASEATENWPNRAVFLHTAAVVEREAGNYGAAAVLAERSIEVEPNFLGGCLELGTIAAMTGNDALQSRARLYFEKALERIKKGPLPEESDSYAWQIITPPEQYRLSRDE